MTRTSPHPPAAAAAAGTDHRGRRDLARRRARATARRSSALKLLCLLPGIVGFVAFALYPRMIDRVALITAIERGLGPAWAASRAFDHADTLLLIGGIVSSAICWFYAELSARRRASRGAAVVRWLQ